jgi:hypothetical protein
VVHSWLLTEGDRQPSPGLRSTPVGGVSGVRCAGHASRAPGARASFRHARVQHGIPVRDERWPCLGRAWADRRSPGGTSRSAQTHIRRRRSDPVPYRESELPVVAERPNGKSAICRSSNVDRGGSTAAVWRRLLWSSRSRANDGASGLGSWDSSGRVHGEPVVGTDARVPVPNEQQRSWIHACLHRLSDSLEHVGWPSPCTCGLRCARAVELHQHRGAGTQAFRIGARCNVYSAWGARPRTWFWPLLSYCLSGNWHRDERPHPAVRVLPEAGTSG